MEYVLLIQGDEAAYAALDEETGKRMYAQHLAFMDEVRAAGVAIPYSVELEPLATGVRVVRPAGGDRLVTDGPFAEAKEQLGGFYVLDVPTIEEAVAWAKKIPMLPTDAVEVRPGR
jgi:hypothetical protein